MKCAEQMNTHTCSTVVNLIWFLVTSDWVFFDVCGPMCGGTAGEELKLMLGCLSPTFSSLTLIPSCHVWSRTQLPGSCLLYNLLTTLWERDTLKLMHVFSFTRSLSSRGETTCQQQEVLWAVLRIYCSYFSRKEILTTRRSHHPPFQHIFILLKIYCGIWLQQAEPCCRLQTIYSTIYL